MKTAEVEHDIEPISLADFLKIARERFDPSKNDTIMEMAEPLVALSTNTDELLSLIRRSVEHRLRSALIGEMPTYHYLFRCEDFGLRTTVWLPEKQRVEVRQIENGLFAYDYPHNHNFDLLTTTVLGEGYETEVFELQSNDLNKLERGQPVQARALGIKQLKPKTVFLYECQKDVHSQIPVRSMSVALNFMVPSREQGLRQFAFRIRSDGRLEVAGTPVNSDARRDFFVRLLLRGRAAGLFEEMPDSEIEALCESSLSHELIDSLKEVARNLSPKDMKSAVSQVPRGSGAFTHLSDAIRERRLGSAQC